MRYRSCSFPYSVASHAVYMNQAGPPQTLRARRASIEGDPSSGSLATGHLFEVLQIPVPFNRDLRGGGVDLAQIICSQFNRERAYILIPARQLGRTRNRND